MLPSNETPKHTIDMTAEPINEAATPAEPPEEAAQHNPEDSLPQNEETEGPNPPARRRFIPLSSFGGVIGIAGYLIAGALGGFIVAGASYFASRQDFAGLAPKDATVRSEIHELAVRTGKLEAALPANSASPGTEVSVNSSGSDALKRVEARLDRVERDLSAKIKGVSANMQALERKTVDESGKDDLQARLASDLAPLSDRVASIERKLQDLANNDVQSRAQAREAALTLAMTPLKHALSEGRPFSEELAIVERLAPGDLPVLKLAPYKDTGIATIDELRSDFEPASRKAMESQYNGNYDSFMGGSGVSLEAILARAGSALKSGDLKKTEAEATTLPSPARAQMQGWLTKLQQRIMADEVVQKTDEELFAVLTKAPATPSQTVTR